MLMRPGLLYRAAMEGVTFGLVAGMHRMKASGVAARWVHQGLPLTLAPLVLYI
jgi:hypothetical protein